jgi:hypothetical protein
MIPTVFILVELSSVVYAQVGWISENAAEDRKQHSQSPIIAEKIILMHNPALADHPVSLTCPGGV